MTTEPDPLSVFLGFVAFALLTLAITLAWSWAGPRIQRWVDSLPEGEPERSRLDDLDVCNCGADAFALDPRETLVHTPRMCYITRREDQP